MVAAARRRNTPRHMPARRIPTAITRQMELVTAAIAPLDIRGTHTCKGRVDAKVTNTSLLIFWVLERPQLLFLELNSWQEQPMSDICLVSCGCRQDIDECSIKSPCTHKCINTEGSFYCICPAGMGGDGLKGGSGCNGVGTLLIAIGKLEALSHCFVM